jgi:hypothetical protein
VSLQEESALRQLDIQTVLDHRKHQAQLDAFRVMNFKRNIKRFCAASYPFSP